MELIHKVQNNYRKYKNSKKILNKNITLISQNCLGGVLYSDFNLEFMSPTINMFIEDESFVKLVENLEYYMAIPAAPLIENFVDPIDKGIRYPKIAIDDVEVCCLHYNNCKEAVESWERRRSRVNLDNVYVIANSWNMHGNANLIKRVCNCKYKVVCFTYGNYNIPNCVAVRGDYWHLDERGIIRPNLTDYIPGTHKRYYEEQFDFVSWFNT